MGKNKEEELENYTFDSLDYDKLDVSIFSEYNNLMEIEENNLSKEFDGFEPDLNFIIKAEIKVLEKVMDIGIEKDNNRNYFKYRYYSTRQLRNMYFYETTKKEIYKDLIFKLVCASSVAIIGYTSYLIFMGKI